MGRYKNRKREGVSKRNMDRKTERERKREEERERERERERESVCVCVYLRNDRWNKKTKRMVCRLGPHS